MLKWKRWWWGMAKAVLGVRIWRTIPTINPPYEFDVIVSAISYQPFTASLVLPQFSTPTVRWACTTDGTTALNLLGQTIKFVAWTTPDGINRNILFEHDNASIGGISISGVGNNQIDVTFAAADTENLLPDGAVYSLWNEGGGYVIAQGALSIEAAQLSGMAMS